MNLKAKLVLIAAAVAVVVIVCTVLLLNARTREHSTATPIVQSNHLQPTYAAVGQVITGFPQVLVVGEKPQISQSYSLSNSSKAEYTTSYTSADSASTVMQSYVSYFQANHYGILSKEQTSVRDVLYAASSVADVSVRIAPAQGYTSVTVSYLRK